MFIRHAQMCRVIAAAAALVFVATQLQAADDLPAQIARLFQLGDDRSPQWLEHLQQRYHTLHADRQCAATVDYVYALVLIQRYRLREAEAVLNRFHGGDDLAIARTKIWVELALNHHQEALADLKQLIARLSQPSSDQGDAAVFSAAGFLGRVVGYLAGPGAGKPAADDLARLREQIASDLPKPRRVVCEMAEAEVLAKYEQLRAEYERSRSQVDAEQAQRLDAAAAQRTEAKESIDDSRQQQQSKFAERTGEAQNGIAQIDARLAAIAPKLAVLATQMGMLEMQAQALSMETQAPYVKGTVKLSNWQYKVQGGKLLADNYTQQFIPSTVNGQLVRSTVPGRIGMGMTYMQYLHSGLNTTAVQNFFTGKSPTLSYQTSVLDPGALVQNYVVSESLPAINGQLSLLGLQAAPLATEFLGLMARRTVLVGRQVQSGVDLANRNADFDRQMATLAASARRIEADVARARGRLRSQGNELTMLDTYLEFPFRREKLHLLASLGVDAPMAASPPAAPAVAPRKAGPDRIAHDREASTSPAARVPSATESRRAPEPRAPRHTKRAAQADPAETLARQGLKAEAEGDSTARAAGLGLALKSSATSSLARWSSGEVRLQDAWIGFDELKKLNEDEAALKEYRRLRLDAKTPDDHLRLADWCRRHKLPAQERAHLLRYSQFVPNAPDVMARLGMVEVGGAWMTRGEARSAAERAKQAALDLKLWVPRLERLREIINRRAGKPDPAADQVRAIRDPHAIPAMELVLSTSSDEAALAVIDALAQMPAPEAAVALARHAVFCDSPDVVDAAMERLKQRPEDSYIPSLLASLVTPMAVQTNVLPGRGGRLLFRQAFYCEGQDRKQLAVLDNAYRLSGDRSSAVAQAEELGSAVAAGRAVAATVRKLQTEELNQRITKVLRFVTGLNLPADPLPWWQWWNEHNEVFQPGGKPYELAYAYFETKVVGQPAISPGGRPGGPTLAQTTPHSVFECLVAGTPVWTDRGAVPVEQVQIGDRVLAQHPTSGELAYQPVVRTTVRPKGPLIEIRLENETLRASGGHPFWVDGRGWVRARNLEPGMLLHQVRGAVRVEEVKPLDDEQETYNLIVDEFHDYFAGASLVLTHDNTVRQPTSTAVPGLPLENSEESGVRSKESGVRRARSQCSGVAAKRRTAFLFARSGISLLPRSSLLTPLCRVLPRKPFRAPAS